MEAASLYCFKGFRRLKLLMIAFIINAVFAFLFTYFSANLCPIISSLLTQINCECLQSSQVGSEINSYCSCILRLVPATNLCYSYSRNFRISLTVSANPPALLKKNHWRLVSTSLYIYPHFCPPHTCFYFMRHRTLQIITCSSTDRQLTFDPRLSCEHPVMCIQCGRR